ncbi:SH3 domain-binding protein 2 isoform X2 [Heterodontus francisci]|uniref:SH3 domain-binding protein 2 isoform X2 n=1 Tax=Heterodontus francisci TaxID=7792 RepID=UPI00355B0A56
MEDHEVATAICHHSQRLHLLLQIQHCSLSTGSVLFEWLQQEWMMSLRKEIDRYHEKADSQGNLSDYSDTEKFYGSVERPVQIKYTSGESESGDYADDDDDDDDEDEYLRPDGLHVSPESEDFCPILNSSPSHSGRSSKKPLPPLPPPNQRRTSLGLAIKKENLPSSLQDRLPPRRPSKTENSALFRCSSPNASPGCPNLPPVHLKPTFCEKELHMRLTETTDTDVKVRNNFAMELNKHLQQPTGKRTSLDVASPSVPMNKGSSAGLPPLPMNKGSSARLPPVPVNKESSAGPPQVPMKKGSNAGSPMHMNKGPSTGFSPVPMNKGCSAESPPMPLPKGSSVGHPPVPLNKGSSVGHPPVPLNKGSSAGPPPLLSNKPTLSPIPSQTEQVKPKLYKPDILPKGAQVLAKPLPVAAKPKIQKHSTLPASPLHRISPEGQSFRSVEPEKPLPRLRSQSQPCQRQESEDDDDDYENVQLLPSVFVNTTESNDVERLFISTSPGSNPEKGLYCIRNSSKSGKVLVVWDDSEMKVRNYRIFEKESKFFLEAEIKFTCLASMVEYYYKHTLPIHNSLRLRVPYGYEDLQ